MTTPNDVQPTQTRHPWRATARTILAGAVGALSLLPVVAVTAGVDAVPLVAQALAVSGAVTRVLALPGVDAWLRRYVPWLAAAPQGSTVTVWVVTVNGRINSVWADQDGAMAHIGRLIEVNGDQLGVRARDLEVRDGRVTT